MQIFTLFGLLKHTPHLAKEETQFFLDTSSILGLDEGNKTWTVFILQRLDFFGSMERDLLSQAASKSLV